MGYDVVLINPYQFGLKDKIAYPPLGLLSIAAYLEKHKIKVKVVNLADKKEVKYEDIPEADYYGITCVTPTYQECKKLVRHLQVRIAIGALRAIYKGKKYSRRLIVVGGVHPTILPLETIDDMRCDIVCVGEGEHTMLEIVKGRPLEKIKGIAYRYKTKWEEETISGMKFGVEGYKNKLNSPRSLIKNLDSLPFPARHLLPEWQIKHTKGVHLDKYSKNAISTSLSLSRGCPYMCSFCCKGHEMFRVVRYRSGKNIAKEIREIKRKYNINHFRINDDILTINRKRLYDICRHIRSMNIFWSCITRADAIDDEKCRMMYDAGCREMAIGVETGSNRLLKMLNKNETTEQMKKAIEIIKRNHIKVKVFLIYGLPTETKKDIELTKKFMRETTPDKWTLSRFVPLPGSELYKKYNPKNDNFWFYPKKNQGKVVRKKYKSFFELEDWLKSDVWRKSL